MKVNSVGTVNNINKSDNNQSNPNFKGLLDAPGVAMNFIEKGGFAASFLIQDTAGMTAPRTGEGLIRGIDKERVNATFRVLKSKLLFKEPSEEDKKKALKFKDLNFKEGAEVGIREGLSGPFMMFTPMLVLALGKKFVGKSTFTNTSMIKRLGEKLTDAVRSTKFDSVKELKENFYRKSISNIVKSTTNAKNEAAESEFIEKATKSLMELDEQADYVAKASGSRKSKAKKVLKKTQSKLINEFNNFHKENSSELSMVNRVKFDGEVYSTEKMINGLRAYAHDALHKKENISEITEKYADSVKKSAIVKRGLVNVAAAASTIGSLSVVPMLYKLVNPIPPGALGDPANADAIASKVASQSKTEQKSNNGQVSFTGKWDKLAKSLEFNGNQFTPALMSALAVGGLMTPRVATAAKRAPEDPVTQKKDYSEIPEILTRDITSTAAVTFGVPMASKALISSYENASGFVLKRRPDKPMSTAKKVLDMLNPFSAYGYYEINDLDQIYGNIDNTEKLGNMAKFVDENGGSLAKILKTEKKTGAVLSEYGLDLKALTKNSDRKAANKSIIDKMNESKEFAEKLVEALKPAKEGKANNILKRARSLNSVVSCAATFLIIPAFLGMVLPKMVYGMTARRQAKAAAAKEAFLAQQKEQQSNDNNTKTIDYSSLKNIKSSQTFQQLKHS